MNGLDFEKEKSKVVNALTENGFVPSIFSFPPIGAICAGLFEQIKAIKPFSAALSE